jgi:hypothetical protein
MMDNRQRARELLEEIELYGSLSEQDDNAMINAINTRHATINENDCDEYQLRELETRAREIKELHYRYLYALKAFVSATHRHGKGGVAE